MLSAELMEIEKDRVVAIEYVLRDDDGNVLDRSKSSGPLHYLHGHGNIIPGLERVLRGKVAGDEFEATIEPQDGYGEYDATRTFEIPKSELGPEVVPQKGMVLTMTGPGGVQVPVTVLKVKLNSVVLDGNHTLAGKRLHFTGKVAHVRQAKKEELSHKHAHVPGQHHHGHGH